MSRPLEAEIRAEGAHDLEAIRSLNHAAFGGLEEADLVDRLRANGKVLLSLVATLSGRDGESRIVGHILFSPARLVSQSGESLSVAALAPMAVKPEYQRRGLGSKLVKAGLGRLESLGHPVVVVLGHPDYYPRFGFKTASPLGVRCPYEAPDEAFMVFELQPGSLRGRKGTIRYAAEFDER